MDDPTALPARLTLVRTPGFGITTWRKFVDATPDLDADDRQLLEALGLDPVGVDDLAARSGLTAETVSSMLLILEFRGHVSAFPGGRYSRTSPDAPA